MSRPPPSSPTHTPVVDGSPPCSGLLLVGAMLVSSVIQTVAFHYHFFWATKTGVAARSTLATIVYTKALRCVQLSA